MQTEDTQELGESDGQTLSRRVVQLPHPLANGTQQNEIFSDRGDASGLASERGDAAGPAPEEEDATARASEGGEAIAPASEGGDTPASAGRDATAPASLVHWVDRLNSKLQNPTVPMNGGGAPSATIFRVPIPLREVTVESYIPKYFAFGLYGHDTATDSSLDVFRLDFARIFMDITGLSWKEVVDVVGSSNWVVLYGDYNLEDQGVGGATDHPKLSSESIKGLLALDSVFIACFIQAYHQKICPHSGDGICPALPALNQEMEKQAFRPLVHLTILDMFKFENQIPLSLLEKYVEKMFHAGPDISGVSDLFTKFLTDSIDLIYCDLPGPSRRERFLPQISDGLKHCTHLLHCLYSVICYKRPDPENSGTAELPGAHPSMERTMAPESQQEGQGVVDPSALTGGRTMNGNVHHHVVDMGPNHSWTDFFKICQRRPHRQIRQRKPHRKHHPPRVHIPTVTQLKAAGIRVAVGDTQWISDVHFKSSMFQGTLYIPAFSVYDETEVVLRNLLTFEYVVVNKQDLLSYIHLMVNLINTEEDVKLMRESGVLVNNSLGSDERMAKMWSEMLSGIVITLSKEYSTVFHQIGDHYDSKYNRWAGELFGLYFRREPWLLIGVVVVLVTAISTIIGMVYTVLTYYYGNKQRS